MPKHVSLSLASAGERRDADPISRPNGRTKHAVVSTPFEPRCNGVQNDTIVRNDALANPHRPTEGQLVPFHLLPPSEMAVGDMYLL